MTRTGTWTRVVLATLMAAGGGCSSTPDMPQLPTKGAPAPATPTVAAPAASTLVIVAPNPTRVQVNGKEAGTTPVSLDDLPAGPYEVVYVGASAGTPPARDLVIRVDLGHGETRHVFIDAATERR